MHKTMMESPRILLWGGGSQTRILLEMIKELDLGKPELIFDETLNFPVFNSGIKFCNNLNELNLIHLSSVTHFVIGIGNENGFARHSISNILKSKGLKPLSVIHAKSFIESSVKLGDGIQVMPGAIVHKFSELGNSVILNTNSTVDHECIIGNGVHVMGGASIAGCVRVGDFASIGTNATIVPHLKIGSGAIIGAGAVVLSDVSENAVMVGCPAREIRKNIPKCFSSIVSAS